MTSVAPANSSEMSASTFSYAQAAKGQGTVPPSNSSAAAVSQPQESQAPAAAAAVATKTTAPDTEQVKSTEVAETPNDIDAHFVAPEKRDIDNTTGSESDARSESTQDRRPDSRRDDDASRLDRPWRRNDKGTRSSSAKSGEDQDSRKARRSKKGKASDRCGISGAPKCLAPRGIGAVSCCSASPASRPSISLCASDAGLSDSVMGLSGEPNGQSNGSMSMADRLRLGRLMDDGLSYKECFIVRCYEVGINKTATVETIANLLQEVGCNHAQSLGYSTDGFATTPTMRKLHLIWVTARMHIEVYKYPAWGDVVEIETWCQSEGRIGTRRDWILKDYATGEVIGRGTSKWVMMNQDTRRLQKVSDDVREEYLIHCPRTPRFAFPEEDSSCLKKIPKLEDPAHYSRPGLVPRRADLDMNQHVNNVTYIGWVLESMPQEVIDSHELQKITLDYRRECQHDDVVDSLTSLELMEGNGAVSEFHGTNGAPTGKKHENDCCQFLHILRLSRGGLEINRGRTEWRRKPMR